MSEPEVKRFGPLYSRRADGAIQTWKVLVKGERYRTVSGIKDGARVRSEWTKAQPKNVGRANSTTSEEQALAEAKAMFKKKQDEGYHANLDDIDTAVFFEPMLAQTFDEYLDDISTTFLANRAVYSQPKLDGMRCLLSAKGMFSRKGKPILSAPHIMEAFRRAKVFEKYGNLVFDGELYADKLSNDFNKIVSLAKKTKPTKADLQESAECLQYHVYDLHTGHDDDAFDKRYNDLRWLLNGMANPAVITVSTTMVRSIVQLDELYSQYMQQGYEGQMIRVNGPYEHKRSKFLLKRKQFLEEEFKVLGVVEGLGNRSNMAGALEFSTKKGKKFTAAVMGTNDFRRQLFVKPKQVIGLQATVKFFAWTPDGSPRFPVVKAIRDYE